MPSVVGFVVSEAKARQLNSLWNIVGPRCCEQGTEMALWEQNLALRLHFMPAAQWPPRPAVRSPCLRTN